MVDEDTEEYLDGDEALLELGRDPDALVGLMVEAAAWVLQKLNPSEDEEVTWNKVQEFVKEGMLDDVVTSTYNKMEEMEEDLH
jgi:hypothetical protein